MCLYTNMIKPAIATEKIECYKVLISMIDTLYLSPYMNKLYEINNEYKAEGEKQVKKLNRDEEFFDADIKIGGGYIHAFCFLDDNAHELCDNTKECFNTISVLTKWTIPVGAEYWIDADNVEICADRMIFDEVIE